MNDVDEDVVSSDDDNVSVTATYDASYYQEQILTSQNTIISNQETQIFYSFCFCFLLALVIGFSFIKSIFRLN